MPAINDLTTASGLVREHLALSELEWRDRVDELERERDAYRELSHAAISHCHDLDAELSAVREQHLQLQVEFRNFRERVMREAGV
jgi:hypothetical protein